MALPDPLDPKLNPTQFLKLLMDVELLPWQQSIMERLMDPNVKVVFSQTALGRRRVTLSKEVAEVLAAGMHPVGQRGMTIILDDPHADP